MDEKKITPSFFQNFFQESHGGFYHSPDEDFKKGSAEKL